MPTVPWSTVREPAPNAEVVVMASRFRVRGFRHVLPFLIDSVRVHTQVLRSEGALGVSLVAHPLRREFRTLSAWENRAALDAMVRSEPHRSVMRRYRGAMADVGFTFWTVPAAALPPTWEEADERLSATM
ncbi:DUF3291 domain-containing protein [Pseudonocardia xinjiangensis]|nr:DUF3291 domain-containing protein [Pseudonocardia xinjiangensis]